MKFKKEVKTIDKYLQLLADKTKNVSQIEVVIIGKYITNLQKAKALFQDLRLKEQNRERLSEGLLLVLRDIDNNILYTNNKKVSK
jgi:hypothetical protein